MTTIGYATLAIIPSIQGVSDAVNKQLGGLKGLGKAAGKDLGKGITGGAEAEVKKLGDTYVKQQDRMKDAAGKLRAEEAKLQDLRDKGVSGGRLVAQTERAEKARRDEARAVKASTEAYKDLEAAQKKLDSGGSSGGGFLGKLKEAASGAGSAGTEAATGFLEGFGGPIAELGTKAGPIGIALASAAALALGAGALIAKNVFEGMDQLQEQANVQAKLGVDAPTMKRIADAAGQAYAGNFGESIAANLDTARVAIQNGLIPAGAGAAGTQKMIEQLTTVSDVLGEDIPATARAAQQAITTGLAPNATAAFDLIVKGQQAGINKSEDLLDTINEYGTQFRKLGLDGPEAFGLISQAIRGGARDSDVAADAIKEFSIRAIDGSKSTMGAFHSLGLDFDKTTEAFGKGGPTAKAMFAQVLQGIQSITDPYEKAQVQVALFGTQSEDLGDALNQMNLSTAVDQLGQVGGAAQAASDTIGGTAASSWESFTRSIEVSTDGVQQSLATAFGPLVKDLAGFVTTHKAELIGFFTDLGDAAISFGKFVLQAVGPAAGMLGDLASALGFDGIGGALKSIQSSSGEAIKALDEGKATMDQFAERAQAAAALTDKLGTSVTSLSAVGDNVTIDVKDNTPQVQGKLDQLGIHLKTFEDDPTKLELVADTDRAQGILDAFRGQQNGDPITPPVKPKLDTSDFSVSLGNYFANLPPQTVKGRIAIEGTATGNNGPPMPARNDRGAIVPQPRARGGRIFGPGTGTSDSIPAWLSTGEFIVNADATRKNMPLLEIINSGKIAGFATGGVVGPDVLAAQALAGTPYSQGNRTDCSGMAARVIARALGLPESGLMTTKNAAQWLAAAGFQPGTGGPGQISVGWYDHGPGNNDGHMAMTLSDGTNAEAGGKNGVFTLGAGASGANSPQFDQHMFLPKLFGGEGTAGSFPGSASGGSGGGVAGIGPNGEAGTYSAPDAKSVREADEKVADADARVRQAELKQKELKADAKESERQSAQADLDKAKREAADARADADEAKKGKFTPGSSSSSDGGSGGASSKLSLPSSFSGFGSAIGEFAGGQIGSALGVFGIPDSPPFLQAASKLIGGISVGGSAAPVAAGGSISGAPVDALGNVLHGSMAGQAPGPQTVYNISTAQIPDAFNEAQRRENVRNAARLDRY